MHTHIVSMIGFLAITTANTLGAPDPFFSYNDSITVDLPSRGWEIVQDTNRDLLYIPMPDLDQVAAVSTKTGQVVNTFSVGPNPAGMHLSADGNTAYIALNDTGSVSVVDLRTFQSQIYDVSAAIGTTKAYDVIEAGNDRVFISSNGNTGQISYVAQLNLITGESERIADGRPIRSNPRFLDDPSGQYIYLGEGATPASLYKFDPNDPDGSIIFEDQHGTVSGTPRGVVNSDGERIFLFGGSVINSTTFAEIGFTARGYHDDFASGNFVFSSLGPDLRVFDADSYEQIGLITIDAFVDSITTEFEILDGDYGFAVLQGERLVLSIPTPSTLIALLCPCSILVIHRRRETP
jgi:hypothetical protein